MLRNNKIECEHREQKCIEKYSKNRIAFESASMCKTRVIQFSIEPICFYLDLHIGGSTECLKYADNHSI